MMTLIITLSLVFLSITDFYEKYWIREPYFNCEEINGILNNLPAPKSFYHNIVDCSLQASHHNKNYSLIPVFDRSERYHYHREPIPQYTVFEYPPGGPALLAIVPMFYNKFNQTTHSPKPACFYKLDESLFGPGMFEYKKISLENELTMREYIASQKFFDEVLKRGLTHKRTTYLSDLISDPSSKENFKISNL